MGHKGLAKGMPQADAMSNSEEMKPMALAIVELQDIRAFAQLDSLLVNWLVSRKFCKQCNHLSKAF